MQGQKTGSDPERVSDQRDERLRTTNHDKAVLAAAYGLYSIKRVLETDIGYFEKELTYRAGLASAAHILSGLEESVKGRQPNQTLDILIDACAENGLGTISTDRVVERDRLIEFTCLDSVEAVGYLRDGDTHKNPSCSYVSGFLAGMAKMVFPEVGKPDPANELVALEYECMSKGDKACKFIVAPKALLEKTGKHLQSSKETIAEHTLMLNEEILSRNLELQNLNLDLERQVRKRTEELMHSEERYRSLVNLSPDPIVICTLDGTMKTINEAAYELLGFTQRDGLIDAKLNMHLLDGEDAWDKLLWQIDKEGTVKGQTMTFVGKNGEKIVGEVSARFAAIHSEKCAHLVIRDVSEKNMLRSKMEQAMNDSEFFNELLSHDIINYMMASMHFIDTLKKSADLSEKDRKAIAVVAKNIKNAYELAAVVRDVTKADALIGNESESKELSQVISEAIDETRAIFSEKKVMVTTELPERGCHVRANPLLGRLFVNILTNAVKFDPKNEAIIRISASPQTSKDKEYWSVRVTDNGKGIPDRDKEKIFERYYRGDDTVPGTGLGLHVVRKIANACGGLVWAENNVDGDSTKGTTMVVLLERAQERREHRTSK